MMKLTYWIVVVVAILGHISALTDSEIDAITKRNANRKCGGYMKATRDGDNVVIERDVVPDHSWGCTNPNAPSAITKSVSLPNNPQFAADGPFCLPMGDIGIALNGVSFFDPLTAEAVNAVEGDGQEIFDCCDAHTAPDGNYHYHKLPVGNGCDNSIFDSKNQDWPQFLGVALDGFPIYSQWNGLNKNTLDGCHGTYLQDGRYAYIAVKEHFPYILGCFRAKPQGTRGGSSSCNGIAAGQTCSCTVGIKNRADVTTETKSKRDVSEAESNVRSALMSLFTKASQDGTIGGCHNDKCIMNEGWGYQNGQCICSGDNCRGPPNGGGDGNRPNGGGGDRPFPPPYPPHGGGGNHPFPPPPPHGDFPPPYPFPFPRNN